MDLSLLLTGRTPPALVDIGKLQLERQTAAAFARMQCAAAQAGFDLQLVSGYRSFERQAAIWRAKLHGVRPVFDARQQKIDLASLQGFAKLEAVLLYSALPGASRHHWGTDFDVYDAAAVDRDYQVQLLESEYQADGPFAPMSDWLKVHAIEFGFFLPYRQYRGGVAAEPWHLSYLPLSGPYLQHFTLSMLQQAFENADLPEQALIAAQLPVIFERYVTNICDAPL
jgi:LAS superfamily LD-carboxypeptidase LdcB